MSWFDFKPLQSVSSKHGIKTHAVPVPNGPQLYGIEMSTDKTSFSWSVTPQFKALLHITAWEMDPICDVLELMSWIGHHATPTLVTKRSSPALSLSSLALLPADSRRWFSMNMMLTDIMVRNGTHRISQITIEKLHEAHLWVPLRLQLQISHGLCSRNPLQKFWEIHGCEGNGATGAGIRKADLGWGSLEGLYIYNYSNVHIPIVQLVKKHKIIYIMQNII